MRHGWSRPPRRRGRWLEMRGQPQACLQLLSLQRHGLHQHTALKNDKCNSAAGSGQEAAGRAKQREQ